MRLLTGRPYIRNLKINSVYAQLNGCATWFAVYVPRLGWEGTQDVPMYSLRSRSITLRDVSRSTKQTRGGRRKRHISVEYENLFETVHENLPDCLHHERNQGSETTVSISHSTADGLKSENTDHQVENLLQIKNTVYVLFKAPLQCTMNIVLSWVVTCVLHVEVVSVGTITQIQAVLLGLNKLCDTFY